MTVRDYLRVLRARWVIVALATVGGVVISLVVFLVRPPEYTANLSLYVSAQVGDDPQQAYQGAQLSEQRVKSYNELATSDRVMGESIRRLGLPGSSSDLARRVSASSALDSVIINISVVDEDPNRAAATADTVGTVLTEAVNELERPTTPNGIPPVAIRVVQPAPTPTGPSSPGLPMTLTLGLLAGLVTGLAAAFARDALDTSVSSLEALATTTGAPNLGTIAYNSSIPQKPLILQDEPHSPRSESFRQLRTNLQFLDVDNPKTVFAVTSALPSEGKSTTVANLAIAMSSTGARVLVVEADLRRPKLSSLFGLDRSVGLTNILSGRVGLNQAIIPWGGGALDVLASGPIPPNPSELLGSNQMRTLLNDVREHYDVVLLDVPPLLPVTDTAAVAPSTDGVLMVCRYKTTTRPQLTAAVRTINAVSLSPVGTIFTMVPEKGPLAYASYSQYYGVPVGAQTGQTDARNRGQAGIRMTDSPTEVSRASSPSGVQPTDNRRPDPSQTTTTRRPFRPDNPTR